MTWESIQEANKTLKVTDVKGKDYVEVNQRIKAFRSLNPNGTIQTDIVSLDGGVVVMQAKIYDEDHKLIGTGLAYEKETSSFINKTSYIENCETSAVGRALGMCGFGIDTSVASAEEVQNAIEQQNKKEDKKEDKKEEPKKGVPEPTERDKVRARVLVKGKWLGMSGEQLAKDFGLNATTTLERLTEVEKQLDKMKEDTQSE